MVVNSRRALARGYTLIEIITTVVMISILTMMVSRGYSEYRDSHRLTTAEQLVQSMAREALQMAMNEDRRHECSGSIACLEYSAGINSSMNERDYSRLCSDVGIAFSGNTNEIMLIADVSAPASNDLTPDEDCLIKKVALPEGVTFANDNYILFEATPPASISKYCKGSSSSNSCPDNGSVQLKSGKKSSDVWIAHYGQVSGVDNLE